MIILVTGASSGLGGALLRRLSNCSGLEMKAMVHRSFVNLSGCESLQGDLDSPESLARAVEGVDTVIHMAALTHSARESEYFKVNVTGTQNLIEACVLAGVKRIIYISSSAASAEGGGYSRSKMEAEECVKRSGLSWLILRPSEVYGQGTGDTINRLVEWVRKYPCVPVVGAGTALFSPVYVDDVVSAMTLSILDAKLESETVLLAGPEALTFVELVNRIAKYFKVRRFKLHLPVRLIKFVASFLSFLGIEVLVPDQIPRLLCSKDHGIHKTSALISYSPRKLEEGLKKYL